MIIKHNNYGVGIKAILRTASLKELCEQRIRDETPVIEKMWFGSMTKTN